MASSNMCIYIYYTYRYMSRDLGNVTDESEDFMLLSKTLRCQHIYACAKQELQRIAFFPPDLALTETCGAQWSSGLVHTLCDHMEMSIAVPGVYIIVYLSISLSLYLHISIFSIPLYLYILYLSISLYLCISISLSLYLSISLYLYLSISLSLYVVCL